MLISCPNCSTLFNVAPAEIGSAGRKVRCTQCSHIWMATLPSVDDADEDYQAGGSLDMDDIDLGDEETLANDRA